MKKIKLILLILIILFVQGCSFNEQKHSVVEIEEGFSWTTPQNMDAFLSNYVWTYNDGEDMIFIQVGANLRLVKTAQKDSDQNLGHVSKLKSYSVGYHDNNKNDSSSGKYPYLMIGDIKYDFLKISYDSFTLANFNDGNPCTFTRKESGIEKFNDRYTYDGKTFFIYFSSLEGSITHEETGMSYKIKQLDNQRIEINEPILSEIPFYLWWKDEKGNLILLSEGFEVSGLSNEEIIKDFPFIVLERVEN